MEILSEGTRKREILREGRRERREGDKEGEPCVT